MEPGPVLGAALEEPTEEAVEGSDDFVAGAVAAMAGIPATFYLAALMFGVTLIIILVLPATKSSTPTPRFAAR